MTKKKLLIISETFLPRKDGVTRFIREVIPGLRDEYIITIACPDYGKSDEKVDATLVKFRPMAVDLGDIRPAIPNIFILAKEIMNADLVWFQSIGMIGMFALPLARLFGKPRALMMHVLEWELYPKAYGNKLLAPAINTIVKFLSKKRYNRMDLVMTPSVETAELLSIMGVDTKKREVNLGIDQSKFCPPKDKHKAKEMLGFSKDDMIIGYIGRLAYEKNLRTLYWAFKRLSAKHPDVKLLIVGSGREDIKRFFVDKKGITYAGQQEDVVPYYQALDVHVLPSLTETTSLSTLEAMSCGAAVVSTPVGFIKEYIEDGVNGMLFTQKDAYMLYRKLDTIISDDALRHKLSKNAIKTIKKRFSWERTLEQIKGALAEL